ncbi:MAG: phosphatidylglycerol lysyltransferase domain-containing protein [Eubacterium sp.]
MNRITTKNLVRIVENLAILLMVVVTFIIFTASFLHIPKLEDFMYHYLEINRILRRMIAIILLISAWNLYKRKRVAWVITILLLATNLGLHIINRQHHAGNILMICEIGIILVLLLGYHDFNRPWDKRSVKKSALLASVLFMTVLLNASFGFFSLRHLYPGQLTFGECVESTVMLLLGFEPMVKFRPTGGVLYDDFIFIFSWICIIGCVILVLKPLIYKAVVTKKDQEHALKLVRKYGQNPESYLILEEDKIYFWGKTVEGVIGYGVVKDVAVVLGDPVCAADDFTVLLSEFKAFCADNAYSVIFLSVTRHYLEIYKQLGFGFVKCGEEARFDLANYNLKGGKAAKMRANVNHANKAEITTHEYHPLIEKNTIIEKEIESISEEWIASKKSSELVFTMGGIGLENPLDKRYFYARNKEGEMIAFIVFIPFGGMNGYMADVTRRKNKAPSGTIQKIMYDAFMIFKEEGIKWGSMGVAPLANIGGTGERGSRTEKILAFAYENLNSFYSFKDLHSAKQHYNPSQWIPEYFIYSPRIITPQMGYAIVRIQNPSGMINYVRSVWGGRK